MFPVRSQFRETINTNIFPTTAERTKAAPLDGVDSKSSHAEPARLEFFRLTTGLYNWSLWVFIFVFLMSQLLGVVWNSSITSEYSANGHNPELGPLAIGGTNDIPYSDRLVACVLVGRQYKPIQLQKALMTSTTMTIDTTGAFVHGYRVIERDELVFDSDTLYASMYDAVASTLDNIIGSRAALGYNVTDDTLRIVNGIESSTMVLIPNALPVLTMPFWDKTPSAKYAIPGWDGSACGSWRNGWYEDSNGSKWYSDLISTSANSSFGRHLFDTSSNVEIDCSNTTHCGIFSVDEAWSSKLSSTSTVNGTIQ